VNHPTFASTTAKDKRDNTACDRLARMMSDDATVSITAHFHLTA
jgi:hypothetical protein